MFIRLLSWRQKKLKSVSASLALVLCLASSAAGQLPDPSNAAILAKLKVLISQNVIRNTALKKQIVQAIKELEYALEIKDGIVEWNDYQKKLRGDLRGIKNIDLTNTRHVKDLILNGDSFDYYFSSTTRQFFRDTHTVGWQTNNANKLLAYLSLGREQAPVTDEIMALGLKELMIQQDLVLQANLKQQELIIKGLMTEAQALKNMAKQKDLTVGERANLITTSSQLVMKAAELQTRLNEKQAEAEEEIIKRGEFELVRNQVRKILTEAGKREISVQKKFGFYDSDNIRPVSIK